VEINAVHYAFIRRTAGELGFENFYPVKANVFNYLRACGRQFDIVFSDAPYDLPGSEEVIPLVLDGGLLRREGDAREDGGVSEGGLLIFEHSSKGQDFSSHPRFLQTRSYGSVQFSIFR
jgi:16S rRNA G966 N2-methylase RsmD